MEKAPVSVHFLRTHPSYSAFAGTVADLPTDEAQTLIGLRFVELASDETADAPADEAPAAPTDEFTAPETDETR